MLDEELRMLYPPANPPSCAANSIAWLTMASFLPGIRLLFDRVRSSAGRSPRQEVICWRIISRYNVRRAEQLVPTLTEIRWIGVTVSGVS